MCGSADVDFEYGVGGYMTMNRSKILEQSYGRKQKDDVNLQGRYIQEL